MCIRDSVDTGDDCNIHRLLPSNDMDDDVVQDIIKNEAINNEPY